MVRIFLTNDDGIRRPGLWALHSAIKNYSEILVLAPENAQSSKGMSLTFHKPLRIKKLFIQGNKAFACTGTPGDCVVLGLRIFFKNLKPDLLVSGINEGNNLSLQSIYGSGTVAAAIRASLFGIPSIAFSLSLPENISIDKTDLIDAMLRAAKRASEITFIVLKKGLPQEVDYLNINFPFEVDSKTPIEITVSSKERYHELVEIRKDPRGKKYIWLKRQLCDVSKFKKGTDAYAVYVNKNISITPMSLNASVINRHALDILAEIFGAEKEYIKNRKV